MEETDSTQKVIYSLVCVCLVLIGGVMSGLTLGLMSLDTVDLEVLVRSGTPNEKKYAKRIQPVLKSPHWTLVTLLLCNAAALEALPIFLDKLLSPVLAVVLSVTAVLLVGEIIPQALCKSYALLIGNYCAGMVRVLCYAVGIISWPVSKVLDYVLGNEHTALFRRAQLKALVTMHSIEENFGGHLSATEINIIGGALDLTNKTAAHGMTPLEKVFMLPADAILNIDTLSELLASGHSRVPVHVPGNRQAVIGLVLVKELVLIDMFANIPVSALSMRPIPHLRADTAMYDLLKLFQTGRTHMVMLTRPPPGAKLLAAQAAGAAASRADLAVSIEPDTIRRAAEEASQRSVSGTAAFAREEGTPPVGIITIEDVIEELLQQEIVDETDTHVDNMRLQKVPVSQRGVSAVRMSPKVASILKGQSALSRATSEPLPDNLSGAKHDVDFVVNIPYDATGEGGLAASAGGSPHVPFPRISSFTGSDGNRRHRRKPFKSSSNRSLQAGHPQKLTSHAHNASGLNRSSGEPSTAVMNSGAESYDGSQRSYSTYAASHDAPVHGFHVQPAGKLHPPHPNDFSLSRDSPRWGKVEGVCDDVASSVADSQETSPATSSNNTGIEPEQKRLITPERELRAKV
ncbi:hypothetical protein ABBQ32_006013 [Trebouxia sp. C0010 RCD-2024]